MGNYSNTKVTFSGWITTYGCPIIFWSFGCPIIKNIWLSNFLMFLMYQNNKYCDEIYDYCNQWFLGIYFVIVRWLTFL